MPLWSSAWSPSPSPDSLSAKGTLLRDREVDSHGDTCTFPTNKVQHPVDDLLIYRALLAAVLFSCTTGNSKVVESETYLKIIQIL